MPVERLVEEETPGPQARQHGRRRVRDATALQLAEPRAIAPLVVDRCDDREILTSAQLEILLTATGSDVDDPGPGIGGDLLPRDHTVLDAALRFQMIEGARVAEPDERTARQALPDVRQ